MRRPIDLSTFFSAQAYLTQRDLLPAMEALCRRSGSNTFATDGLHPPHGMSAKSFLVLGHTRLCPIEPDRVRHPRRLTHLSLFFLPATLAPSSWVVLIFQPRSTARYRNLTRRPQTAHRATVVFKAHAYTWSPDSRWHHTCVRVLTSCGPCLLDAGFVESWCRRAELLVSNWSVA